MILIPVALLALFLGYNPFTVGAVAGITVTLWVITAIAKLKKKGVQSIVSQVEYPVIDCPAVELQIQLQPMKGHSDYPVRDVKSIEDCRMIKSDHLQLNHPHTTSVNLGLSLVISNHVGHCVIDLRYQYHFQKS